MSKNIKHAFLIGTMCSVSYLTVYIARNTLSAVTPQLVSSTDMTNEYIGMISSLYFAFYAVGQLVNGLIGERIKGKYMVSLGLVLGGICNVVFMYNMGNQAVASLMYGLLGFCLSMVYPPMSKIIAENTEPQHAQKCCLAIEFAALFGAPLAGIIAGVCAWKIAFRLVSVLLLIMGIFFFSVLHTLEKNGVVKFNRYIGEKEKKQGAGIRVLIQNKIIQFTMISALTGIVRTAVVFWLPTYIAQYLGFSAKTSALIYSVATIIISTTAFFAMFIYERFHRNIEVTIMFSFTVSTIAFVLLFFIKVPIINVLLIVLAVMASNCASAMIWVVYCPGLRDTGMVSTVTGYLDFITYLAGAVSNIVFANAVSAIGWQKLILIWAALMGAGVLVSIPKRRMKR